MGFIAKVRTTALAVGLVGAPTALLSGCDDSDKSANYKPIESNILKKLGQANQSQSDAAAAKKADRLKVKKR